MLVSFVGTSPQALIYSFANEMPLSLVKFPNPAGLKAALAVSPVLGG